MSRGKSKVYESDIALLDPGHAGSTIGYVVGWSRSGRLYGDVHLSDCDRKITWYFSNDAESVTKIDKAIQMLTNFRTMFIAAGRLHKKSKRPQND